MAYGPHCMKCKKAGKLTIDHIVPQSKGGISHITNYQLLCADCNQDKKDTIQDFRPFPYKVIR